LNGHRRPLIHSAAPIERSRLYMLLIRSGWLL